MYRKARCSQEDGPHRPSTGSLPPESELPGLQGGRPWCSQAARRPWLSTRPAYWGRASTEDWFGICVSPWPPTLPWPAGRLGYPALTPSLSAQRCCRHSPWPSPTSSLSPDSWDREKKEREDTQITNIRNQTRAATDASGTRRIIFWPLEANKFDNLHETDRLFGRHTLPNLDTRETENLNSFLSSKVIKFLTENYSTKKTPGWDGFIGEFYTIKKEIPIPTVRTFFEKTKAKGTLCNWFYKASITLIPKPDKNISKKEKYTPIALMTTDVKSLRKY